MLGLRSALTWLLPELPSWLAAEIARAEHCRREMQCKGTSPRPSPPTPPSTTSTQPEQEAGLLAHHHHHHHDQSLDSQIADDAVFLEQQSYPRASFPSNYTDDIMQFGLQRNIETDVSVYEKRDSSPDSPPSQVCIFFVSFKNNEIKCHNIFRPAQF